MTKKAVILLSGGLDSTTVLALAKQQGFECYTVSFDYGQRHRCELDIARNISKTLGAKQHHVFKLSYGDMGGSALTDNKIDVPDYTGSEEIPVTYVPARNTVFLSMALGYAEVVGAYDMFLGISCIDYSHYIDCRPEYLEAFQNLANLATKEAVEGKPTQIHAPLLKLSKAETILKGIELGVDYSLTVSCYQATDDGKACGRCDSCTLRRQGFEKAGVSDPTIYI